MQRQRRSIVAHADVVPARVPPPLFAARVAQGFSARALLRLAQARGQGALAGHLGVAGLATTRWVLTPKPPGSFNPS